MSKILKESESGLEKLRVYEYGSMLDIDDVIIQLINESLDTGFIRCTISKKDSSLLYYPGNLCSIENFSLGNSGPELFGEFLTDLEKIMAFLEDSFIDLSYCSFDPEDVYVDTESGKLHVMVIPASELDPARPRELVKYLGEHFLSEDDVDLRDKIIRMTDSAGDEMQLVKNLLQILGSDDTVLNKVAGESTEEHMQDREKKNSSVFLLRKKTGEIIPLPAGTFIIGKAPVLCDYTVEDNPALSRMHAIIRYLPDEDEYCIFDCGSTNHVYLEGLRIEDFEPRLLAGRMRIHLATEEFIFNRS